MQAARSQPNRDEQVASVLQLAVQHCPDLSTQADLCSLLQVNQPCRTALQRSTGHLELSINWGWGMKQLAQFCAWLPAHAGLLSHIGMSALGTEDQTAACQLLLFALQTSATQQKLARASAALLPARQSDAGPQHGQPQQQAPPVLQLRSYHSGCLTSTAVLAALNQQCAACLTRLNLCYLTPQQLTQRWCTALAALPALRQLHLHIGLYIGESVDADNPENTPDELPSECTTAIAKLRHLTELTLKCFIPPQGLQQVPASLQRLTMESEREHAACATTPLQLAHLDNLQQLQLMTQEGLPDGSQLPSALTALTVYGPAGKVQGLATLREVQLASPYQSMQLLQLLPDLTSLTCLEVAQMYLHSTDAAQDMRQLFDAIQSLPQIRALSLFAEGADEDDWLQPPQPLSGISLHATVGKLPQLQSLHVLGLDLVPADALELTCFTGLTDLVLCGCESMGDLAATAIVCRLTNLRQLTLQDCGLQGVGFWPAVANLTTLEDLIVHSSNMAFADNCLTLLTTLTRLNSLSLYILNEVSEQARNAFLAAMPQLGDRLY